MRSINKSWTRRRPVKIICVVMIPVLLFIAALGAIGLENTEYTSFALLLSDLDKNDYFYDSYMSNALSHVQSMFWLQSEDNIRNLGCLEWQQIEYYVNPSDGEYYTHNIPLDPPDPPVPTVSYGESDASHGEPVRSVQYDLVSTNRANQWRLSISAGDTDSEEAKYNVEYAVRQQLSEFYYAKNWLEETPGLHYFITDGDRWFGNVPPDAGADFFKEKPVYLINEFGKNIEQSRTARAPNAYPNQGYYDSNYYDADNISVYVAFSSEVVNWQNNIWRSAQHQLENQLMLAAIPLIAAFALFVILIVGAGREHGAEASAVNLMVIDKPWWDLSLCVLIGYEAVVGYVIYRALDAARRYNSTKWMVILFAAASVALTLPALWWILNFTKRCKAGKFWRHSMCYVIIRRVFTGVRRFFKSLWAGARLTTRVVLIGLALFFGTIICTAWTRSPTLVFFYCLLLSAIAVFLLLRYAKKLNVVDQGAKAASLGRYDEPICVVGGELGSIAASINNISDGINIAVSERLKSERLKTELITNISHDIRTPLTSLITYTDLLKNEGLGNEKAPEYLEILIQKSARLKTLIDDLFEASKAASGNIEAHVEDLDLADFVRQVLGELDERVRESGLDFRLNLPEHAAVRADGKLLWRVMENLLSNVFKYALAGSRVYIDAVQENGSYRLDIKNVSERPLNVEPSELLERFSRGDDARGGEGSGLGLSIAQSFVNAQGGQFALSIDGDLFKASLYLSKQ